MDICCGIHFDDEKFLKHGTPTVNQLKIIKKTIIHFISNTINTTCNRLAGQGSNLLKNHLFFHLELYIKNYGPAEGFDSGPSESHHKMSIKASSKTTQGSALLLIEQTGDIIMQNKILDRVVNQFAKPNSGSTRTKK